MYFRLNDAWLGPDNRWLLAVVLVLLVTGALGLLHFRVSARRPSATLKRWGVPLNHVKRALREIERKTFHLFSPARASTQTPVTNDTPSLDRASERATARRTL